MSIKSTFRSKFDYCVVRVATAISASSALLSLSLAPVFAQSTNPNSPTLLTTNVISGRGSMDRELVYYYRFTAKPGKLAITLDLDADEQKGNTGAATINLQTSNDSQSMPTIAGSASPGNPSRTFRQVELRSTTPVILVLKLSKGSTAGYGYRVKIDGDRADLPI
jgi:hypothetical protein